jgi:ring-1,2-phenylacetyl-CoA epoxidase subunit PaaA
MIAGKGPCNHERIEARRKAWEGGKWVRDTAVVYAKNSNNKQQSCLVQI